MKSNCKRGQRLPPRLEITSATRNPGHKDEKTKEETEIKRKKKHSSNKNNLRNKELELTMKNAGG